MKRIIFAGVIVAIVALIVMSMQGESSPEEYVSSIKEHRNEISKFMNDAANSPFAQYPDSVIKLNYFAPDPAYKVRASITLIEGKKMMTLANSDGTSSQYRRYAYASFNISGKDQKLLILRSTDGKKNLSTMFADLTSNEDTYGGGRYLDLNFKNARTITIDFNKAYNPYCMYNVDYACPLPPRENFLEVRIKAGEKTYQSN